MRIFTILSVFMLCISAQAQVGIGTATPSTSSILDISANDKGVLMPRVPLVSKSDTTTITNGNVLGLIVFNTTNQNDVTPGFYYWDNTEWVRLSTSTGITNDDFQVVYIAAEGQVQFSTPLAFSNPNKINVFRNGVRVGFSQVSPSLIELEAGATCYQNDEIRILQNN